MSAPPWIDPAPLVRAITLMPATKGSSTPPSPPTPQFDFYAAATADHVKEGPLFHVDTVSFAAPVRSTEAVGAFGIKPGGALAMRAADGAVQSLRTLSSRRVQYRRVTVTSQATRRPGGADGQHRRGRAAGVAGHCDAKFDGPHARQPRFARHRPACRSAVWAQRASADDTSVYRQVDIQAVPIDRAEPADEPRPDVAAAVDQPIQARVTLEEWPPLRIRYGFELDDQQLPASESRDLRPGVAADATYRNVFGRAATTGLALRYTKDFEAARVFFSTPSFFGLPLTSNLFLARSREQLGVSSAQPFITDKSEFTAEQRFRVGRRLQVAYSYNLQRNHSFDPNADPEDPAAFDLTVSIARLTATALVDTRDDLVDATRGVLLSSTFEYGAGALGSDLRFAKYFFQQNYYRKVGRGVVFGTSGRLGLAAGFGQDLIPSERFRAGGGNSLRGFNDDTLGPRDVFGDPAGRNALVILNEDVRFPIAWRFRGVGFVDASAFATIGESAWSVGVGAGGAARADSVCLAASRLARRSANPAKPASMVLLHRPVVLVGDYFFSYLP